jgi:hypothetical protein
VRADVLTVSDRDVERTEARDAVTVTFDAAALLRLEASRPATAS